MSSGQTARRPFPAMAIAAVISLLVGYVVLQIVNTGIVLLWETIPGSGSATPAWYVIGLLLIAALLVFIIRRYIGDAGHSPIGGIAISDITPRQYVGVILAIVASLWGGVVLGPEVALVTTGSVIGGVVAKSMGIIDPTMSKKVIGIGALGAILALFVGPILAGTLKLGSLPKSIAVDQLGWAIVVALITTLAVTVSRVAAALLARRAGTGPHVIILIAAALIVAVSALTVQHRTNEGILFIVTSGEEFISKLPTLTVTSTVVAILIFKAIAYAVSLGSGFRGGPFFPAMFIGASAGLIVSLTMGSTGPSVPAAIVVGVVASLIATAPMKWPIAIALGALLGLVMGTWTLVPAAVLGAVIARAVPRWGDRITSVIPTTAVHAGR